MKREIPIDRATSSQGAPEAATAPPEPGAQGPAATDGPAPSGPVADPHEEATAPSDPPQASDGDEEGLDDTAAADVEAGDDVEARLAVLHDEIATLNDQHLRLAAEFQNYRKRVTREREEMRARSQAELVGVLLDALDDLERVTNVDTETASVASLIEGVDLVERKLQRALEAAGAETIDAVGQRFDPETMEAIGALPTDDPEQDETVAMTFQRGYRMHGILVRPARVQVFKHGG
ncbi:MAG TPA: nucleotide exchange factor GrpE [Longimicrobiales bacterium]|nr:nucleotide exchange factor GrpE [Longimicrobiales bacterium]